LEKKSYEIDSIETYCGAKKLIIVSLENINNEKYYINNPFIYFEFLSVPKHKKYDSTN